MRLAAFIIVCTVIITLGVSTPLGAWSCVPIFGLALVAMWLIDTPRPPIQPFDREWDS